MENEAATDRASQRHELLTSAMFRDRDSGILVIDVTDWTAPVDRAVVAEIGDPALICFGGHGPEGCALDSSRLGEHDVVLETPTMEPEVSRFLKHLGELLSDDVSVLVRNGDGSITRLDQSERT
jgi:hypothetical protein